MRKTKTTYCVFIVILYVQKSKQKSHAKSKPRCDVLDVNCLHTKRNDYNHLELK